VCVCVCLWINYLILSIYFRLDLITDVSSLALNKRPNPRPQPYKSEAYTSVKTSHNAFRNREPWCPLSSNFIFSSSLEKRVK
jgi:hypothetical protein